MFVFIENHWSQHMKPVSSVTVSPSSELDNEGGGEEVYVC